MGRDGDTAPVKGTRRGYDFHTLYLIGTESTDPGTGKLFHTTSYGGGHNVETGEPIEPHDEQFWGQPDYILMHPKSCPTSERVEDIFGKPITVVSHLCEWSYKGPLEQDLDRFMATDARPREQGTYRILYEGSHVTGCEPVHLASDDDDDDPSEAPTSEG